MNRGSIVAVGVFDGVHAGHRYLLSRLVREARLRDLTPVVVTFARHPLAVIRPDAEPPLLTDVDTRVNLLRQQGIDNIHILDFDEEMRNLTAAGFAEKILRPRLDARAVIIGYDNGFGSDRLQGLQQYRAALSPLNIDVVGCDALDSGTVSSTIIRQLVEKGDIRRANDLLGRPFQLSGTVVHGKQVGRTLGFPTANIELKNSVLPAVGVYVGRVARCADGSCVGLTALVNVGHAPTVNGSSTAPVTVEAYIFTDVDVDLYGTELAVDLLERLRDEKHFQTIEELRSAIEADKKKALELTHGEEASR